METQPTGIHGKADSVSDETPMMAILSLNHARNQTVRMRYSALASESYGESLRPHFKNPWAGPSWESDSSPASGLAANQVPKQAGLSIQIFSNENVDLKHSLCLSQTQTRSSRHSVHSSPRAFTHIYFILTRSWCNRHGNWSFNIRNSYTYLDLTLR